MTPQGKYSRIQKARFGRAITLNTVLRWCAFYPYGISGTRTRGETIPASADGGGAREETERAAPPAGDPWQVREKRRFQAKPVPGRLRDPPVAANAGGRDVGVGTRGRHHREWHTRLHSPIARSCQARGRTWACTCACACKLTALH